MIINEIFYSLQGEGALSGVPSVFVRLAGCPLCCRWCDTKYAWSESAGTDMTTEEVKAQIEKYPTRYVVVTGGEPMVQEGLVEFITGQGKGKHITVETAGIKYVPDLRCDLMSISPKLSNSKPEKDFAEHEAHRIDAEAVKKLIENYEYQFKFVVDSLTDLDEIAEFLNGLGEVNPYKVFLMPQATEREELIRKSQMLAEYCKRTGFILGQRLQVLLWNSQRGK